MLTEPVVSVFYGPLSWLEHELADEEYEGFLDLVIERDERAREVKHVVPGQELGEADEPDPPDTIVAYSADYASLQGHVLSNFSSVVRQIDPRKLILHNPPTQVFEEVSRVFPTTVHRYAYPTVNRDTLRAVRDQFGEHLIGQEHVRNKLLAGLYPLVSGNRKNPIVMMFYGPSGVGKTETAKFVNGLLGGELLRKQFSMFHNNTFASYLFGGKHSESSFARDLLDRESGVILIDEFDKANSVFHSAFYQLFDEGVFVDKNNNVQVGPALIICTSNYASEGEIQDAIGDALFSRFDAVIGFEELSAENLIKVIDRLIDRRLSSLDAGERAALDSDALRALLHPAASRSANVRHLTKLIDELIALRLVEVLLLDQREFGE